MSRVPCRVVSVTCAVCCLRAARPCVRSAAARAAGCARAFFNIKEYGDSMILAVCIFSQSATGEVSSAYFRKLAISRGGECKFSQTGPTRAYARNTLVNCLPDMRPASTSKRKRSEEEEEEPEFDSSGDEIPLCET